MIRTDNHARQRHKTLNEIMKLQQGRQSNGNKSESPALNKTGATTSRQVQLEAVDNTSYPGRPVLDELVPSRYALKGGEIDVLVVSDGVLSLPGAMLGHNVDPAAVQKNRRSKNFRRMVAMSRSINGCDQGTWGTVCTLSTSRIRRLACQRWNWKSGSWSVLSRVGRLC